MLQAEITILHALSAANGSPVKAEVLQEKSGFSDAELQIVMDSLVSKGWAKTLSGGELSGQPLRFYFANITPSGTAALLPHMKFANQSVSKLDNRVIQTDMWHDITIEDTEYLILIEGRTDDFDGNGERQVLVSIKPKNIPSDVASPEPIGSAVNLNDDLAED